MCLDEASAHALTAASTFAVTALRLAIMNNCSVSGKRFSSVQQLSCSSGPGTPNERAGYAIHNEFPVHISAMYVCLYITSKRGPASRRPVDNAGHPTPFG